MFFDVDSLIQEYYKSEYTRYLACKYNSLGKESTIHSRNVSLAKLKALESVAIICMDRPYEDPFDIIEDYSCIYREKMKSAKSFHLMLYFKECINALTELTAYLEEKLG